MSETSESESDPSTCEHTSLRATVTVVKYAEYQVDGADRRMAEAVIRCEDCGVPFRWRGVGGGLHPNAPCVGVAAVELRAPIEPALDVPREHWRMLLGEEALDA